MGMVRDLFKRFEARQPRFFEELSKEAKEKLAGIENKYAELRVTGPEGDVIYFQYKGRRLEMLDGKPDIPYEKMDKFLLDGDGVNYLNGDDVLLDVIDGSLSPRAVVSHKFFQANTDRIIYDTEEFASAFERFLDEMRAVLGHK